MKMRFSWFILIIIPIFLISCRTKPKEKGYEYFSDMVHTGGKLDKDGKTVADNKDTTVYEAYDLNPNFGDGQTAQKPTKGSIPRGYKLYNFPYRGTFPNVDIENKIKDAENAGKSLPDNPIEGLKSVLAYEKKDNIKINIDSVYKRGSRLYDTFCTPCHGQIGGAVGPIASKGMAGPNLAFPPASSYTAGRLFYVISMGNMMMPSHASQISPADRWKLIFYIKTFIQNLKK